MWNHRKGLVSPRTKAPYWPARLEWTDEAPLRWPSNHDDDDDDDGGAALAGDGGYLSEREEVEINRKG